MLDDIVIPHPYMSDAEVSYIALSEYLDFAAACVRDGEDMVRTMVEFRFDPDVHEALESGGASIADPAEREKRDSGLSDTRDGVRRRHRYHMRP